MSTNITALCEPDWHTTFCSRCGCCARKSCATCGRCTTDTCRNRCAGHAAPEPAGPTVWVLSAGEMHEGGTVLGVYATKDLAKGPFTQAALNIPFAIDQAWQDDDGAVHAEGGCDWVSLEPHPLITRAQLT